MSCKKKPRVLPSDVSSQGRLDCQRHRGNGLVSELVPLFWVAVEGTRKAKTPFRFWGAPKNCYWLRKMLMGIVDETVAMTLQVRPAFVCSGDPEIDLDFWLRNFRAWGGWEFQAPPNSNR